MLEIEMKFRVPDAAEYERRLADEFGVRFGDATPESDVFFTCEKLGFPNEGKALRIRRRGNYLATTFKGPRLDETTKTREEIELPLLPEAVEIDAESSARVERTRADWIRFFERLGFEPFAEVNKIRRRATFAFAGREFELTLDVLPELGSFAEIETIAPKDEFEDARLATTALAAKFGLKESIVKSYLALLQEAKTGAPVDEK